MLRCRADPQALDIDRFATFHAPSVTALRYPQQGGVDGANGLDVTTDVCQRDIDQQIGQRRVLAVVDPAGQFDRLC